MGGGSASTCLALISAWPPRQVEGLLALQQLQWLVSGFGEGGEVGRGWTGWGWFGPVKEWDQRRLPPPGQAAWHVATPVCVGQIANGDSYSPTAGPGALLRERRRLSLSPEEIMGATVVPIGSSSGHLVLLLLWAPGSLGLGCPCHF